MEKNHRKKSGKEQLIIDERQPIVRKAQMYLSCGNNGR